MSLNDPQWGRGSGSGGEGKESGRPADGKDASDTRPERDMRPHDNRSQRPGQDGPPDLEELWRDFNRRLNGLFGKGGPGGAGDGR